MRNSAFKTWCTIRVHLPVVLLIVVFIFLISCDQEQPEKEDFIGIENISFENYPKVDGSTSASVLNRMVACKLLGVSYHWQEPGIVSEWTLLPAYEEIPESSKDFFWQRVKSSKTHGAFINLIDGEVDIILTHRTISPDENRTYPFISRVYVAIRSNPDPNSMAYKLYEWLQSEDAKATIRACGFLTN